MSQDGVKLITASEAVKVFHRSLLSGEETAHFNYIIKEAAKAGKGRIEIDVTEYSTEKLKAITGMLRDSGFSVNIPRSEDTPPETKLNISWPRACVFLKESKLPS